MNLTEVRQILAADEIRLTKALGQNFLIDANQVRRILSAAYLQATDAVLEIGPGLGSLTQHFLEQAGEVYAIEKDQRLFDILKRRFANQPTLTLVRADALDHLRAPRDWSRWKMVANLPYSVASPLLVECARMGQGPELVVVTLQLEVAHRLFARANDPDYGVLPLLIRLRYDPKNWFRIPPSCFFPRPDVDSACVVLERRKQSMIEEPLTAVFAQIVKRAFSQRRKMMLKLLKADWAEADLQSAFARVGLPPESRAETVSLDHFVGLTRELAGEALTTKRAHMTPPSAEEIFDVVNERDEVIGQATRPEVHRRGLRHRAVHVLLFNRVGEIFLQQRSLAKDTHPGLWDSSASGHLMPGEGYDAAALRELREELGVTLEAPLKRLFKIAACAATGQEFIWVYRGDSAGPFTLHPEEIQAGAWYSPATVARWLREHPEQLSPTLPLLWEQLLSRRPTPSTP